MAEWRFWRTSKQLAPERRPLPEALSLPKASRHCEFNTVKGENKVPQSPQSHLLLTTKLFIRSFRSNKNFQGRNPYTSFTNIYPSSTQIPTSHVNLSPGSFNFLSSSKVGLFPPPKPPTLIVLGRIHSNQQRRHSMIPSHSPHLTVSPPGSTAEAWDSEL